MFFLYIVLNYLNDRIRKSINFIDAFMTKFPIKLFSSFFLISILFLFNIFPSVRANSNYLINDVFTFQEPYHELIHGLSLNKGKEYNIHFEIVSPHNCTMAINLADPQGSIYELFRISLNFPNGFGFSKDFSHVAAMTGLHYLIVKVWTEENINIHLSVEDRGDFKFESEFTNKTVETTIEKVHDGYSRQFTRDFKKNYLYEFIFKRVSPIRGDFNIFATIEFWIQTSPPNQTRFVLLANETLPDVMQLISTQFGTAINDTYTCNYTIHSNIEPFNLVHGIVEKYLISENAGSESSLKNETEDSIPEENDSSSNSSSTNETEPSTNYSARLGDNSSIFVSQQQFLGTLTVAGGGTLIIMVIFYSYKKKNKITI